MHARVTFLTSTPNRLDDLTKGFESAFITKEPGFLDGFVLVDRQTGKAMTMTLWRDRASLDRTAKLAKDVREDASRGAGGTVDEVRIFEVASQASQLVP